MQVRPRTSKASHLILDRLQEDLGLESMLCRRTLGLISGIPHGPLSTAKVAQEQTNNELGMGIKLSGRTDPLHVRLMLGPQRVPHPQTVPKWMGAETL